MVKNLRKMALAFNLRSYENDIETKFFFRKKFSATKISATKIFNIKLDPKA